MRHAVLLGDSIFDNAAYVPGCAAVIDQLREALGGGWGASLLAVDGSTAVDVPAQLTGLPAEASHLVLSVGGNDALQHSYILDMDCCSAAQVLHALAEARESFRLDYQRALAALVSTGLPLIVCTVYDAIPWPDETTREITAVALAVFNDCIVGQAAVLHLPVLDLRSICTEPQDYSALSPIEPSHLGGKKIALAIAQLLREHDFGSRTMSMYPQIA